MTSPLNMADLPSHDDDELAAALRAQLLRFAPSGPIPIIRPGKPKTAPVDTAPPAAPPATPAPVTPTVSPSAAAEHAPPLIPAQPPVTAPTPPPLPPTLDGAEPAAPRLPPARLYPAGHPLAEAAKSPVLRPPASASAALRPRTPAPTSSGARHGLPSGAHAAPAHRSDPGPASRAPYADREAPLDSESISADSSSAPAASAPIAASAEEAPPAPSAPPAPPALSAIDRLEALVPSLQRLALPDEQYQDWVRSLEKIGHESAGRPSEAQPDPSAHHTDNGEEQSDHATAPDRATTLDTAPTPELASAPPMDPLLAEFVAAATAKEDADPSGEPARSPFDTSEMAALDSGKITTGSIPVVSLDRPLDHDVEDDADDVANPYQAVAVGDVLAPVAPAKPGPDTGPIVPIASPRVEPETAVLVPEPHIEREPRKPVEIEASATEPTPTDQRAARAARMFWLWFAANSSFLTIAVGAVIFSFGLSLRQSIIAALAGVVLSAFPLAVTTVIGKRSGQPTLVVSRASFGVRGNILPAIVGTLTRLFWGAAFLWLLAISTGDLVREAGWGIFVTPVAASFVAFALFLVLGLFGAFFGYWLIARLQLVLSVVSALAVAFLIFATSSAVDFSAALAAPDGSWISVIGGAVAVFSVVGLLWAVSGSDLARYQRPSSSTATNATWAALGAGIPAFVLIGYGALLAASNDAMATGLPTDPIGAIADALPDWFPVPLLLAVAVSLFSGLLISIYSGGLALQASGVRINRQSAVVLVALAIGAGAIALIAADLDLATVITGIAPTLAVPIAAWIGIVGGELLLRSAPFDSDSLLRPGGRYPAVRWPNLAAFVLITAVGYGFLGAAADGLGWQGYLLRLLGQDPSGEVGAANLGVLIALVLGVLVAVFLGAAVRHQEGESAGAGQPAAASAPASSGTAAAEGTRRRSARR